MKWATFFVLAACGPAPAPRVELATPRALPVAPVSLPAETMPADAAPMRGPASGDWARAFPADKTFRAIDLPPAARVLLTWRVGRERAVKPLPDGEDYAANHVAETSLVIRAGGRDVTISFGEMSGSPSPLSISYCRNRGWHAKGEKISGFSGEAAVAASFQMSIPQGADEYMVVRDGGTLHLLHRETSDGHCDEGKEGPLDICVGSEWSRLADIRVGTADLFERLDYDGGFDCGAETWGERLVFP